MDSKELFGETQESEDNINNMESAQPLPAEAENLEAENPEVEKPEDELPELTPEQVQQEVLAEAKKGTGGAVVAIVTLLFILLIGLCVYIAVSLSSMIPGDKEKIDTEYEAETEDPWEEILGDQYKQDDQDADENADENTQVYENHESDDFSGPYYEDVVDCIDENVSYEIVREFSDYVNKSENVVIRTSYIQLEGEIPGRDAINEELKEETTFFVNNFLENKESILSELEEYGMGVQAEIESYVTYNTESMVSIAVRENISVGSFYQDVAIRSYNINLDTGTILDNTSILNIEEGFGEEFKNRSLKQNGDSVEIFSGEEIEQLLTSEGSLILFYTPLGMEIGYNYRGSGYIGWVTITLQDYEAYVKSL